MLLAWWGLALAAEAQACAHPSFPGPSQALSFSHLILATGSTGLFPGKFNKVSSQQMAIQAYEDMVTQVSCPLTRGGGPPGEWNSCGDAWGCSKELPESAWSHNGAVRRKGLLGGDLWTCHEVWM